MPILGRTREGNSAALGRFIRGNSVVCPTFFLCGTRLLILPEFGSKTSYLNQSLKKTVCVRVQFFMSNWPSSIAIQILNFSSISEQFLVSLLDVCYVILYIKKSYHKILWLKNIYWKSAPNHGLPLKVRLKLLVKESLHLLPKWGSI